MKGAHGSSLRLNNNLLEYKRQKQAYSLLSRGYIIGNKVILGNDLTCSYFVFTHFSVHIFQMNIFAVDYG